VVPASSVRPSTRRGPRQDRDAARRTRLLDTGLEVFGTVGYARSAIEAICASAGVGTRSFYELFESKEDLLVAVYDRVVSRLGAAMLEELGSPPSSVEEHVRTGVQAFVDHVTDDERAARVQLLEVVGVSERLERHRRDVIHAFAGVIRHESRRMHEVGLMTRPLSPMLATALSGATNELLIDWLVAERRPSRRRLVDELARLYVSVARGA
jgi:AcrR family transcriptional regulator